MGLRDFLSTLFMSITFKGRMYPPSNPCCTSPLFIHAWFVDSDRSFPGSSEEIGRSALLLKYSVGGKKWPSGYVHIKVNSIHSNSAS